MPVAGNLLRVRRFGVCMKKARQVLSGFIIDGMESYGGSFLADPGYLTR